MTPGNNHNIKKRSKYILKHFKKIAKEFDAEDRIFFDYINFMIKYCEAIKKNPIIFNDLTRFK